MAKRTESEPILSKTLMQALARADGESAADVYAKLGLKQSRAHDLMRGGDPGTLENFAIVMVRFVVPKSRGSEKAAAMKGWSILRELYPHIFAELNQDNTSVAA